MKWHIDNVRIDNQVVLAPMSGICDSAFRRIAKYMGCGLLEGEMISSNAIYYKSRKTEQMLYSTENEKPLVQQIFGSDIETLKYAARHIEDKFNPEIIDINMGCPVNKVAVEKQSGSALLKNPQKVRSIIENVSDSVNTPVTVKIRSGWDEQCINGVEIARIAEESGASAITVHPRTKIQGYSGKSDWSVIRDVKENVNIPVIGNGDITDCFDAQRMLDTTGCDAVMIGREAIGNPWIIRDCVNYLKDKTAPADVTLAEKVKCIKKHTDLLINLKGERIAILKMRNHLSHYFKSIPGNRLIKERVFKARTRDELFNILDSLSMDN